MSVLRFPVNALIYYLSKGSGVCILIGRLRFSISGKRNTLIYYLIRYDFVQYTTVYEYILSGVGNSTIVLLSQRKIVLFHKS